MTLRKTPMPPSEPESEPKPNKRPERRGKDEVLAERAKEHEENLALRRELKRAKAKLSKAEYQLTRVSLELAKIFDLLKEDA